MEEQAHPIEARVFQTIESAAIKLMELRELQLQYVENRHHVLALRQFEAKSRDTWQRELQRLREELGPEIDNIPVHIPAMDAVEEANEQHQRRKASINTLCDDLIELTNRLKREVSGIQAEEGNGYTADQPISLDCGPQVKGGTSNDDPIVIE
ncbi:hypothetical protein CC1G_10125 [Coprinopsis cinerea okayama7|uniref:Uncharacterized protein n=1 Tax=Coprinopsis cinerea (strain Okayama-7 / 130 / ATCC MYA-4618 / FGSC 9003) TaxID=240176 RepID=A8N3Y6_COPC7|nr:hypothetical protein CC1G_10125 [Coprinopsis cinerea okayama7\|eukprot:XP_001829595.1 hypothetical protein CC1G_10125 [Coprinopsis cinerea okayama7\